MGVFLAGGQLAALLQRSNSGIIKYYKVSCFVTAPLCRRKYVECGERSVSGSPPSVVAALESPWWQSSPVCIISLALIMTDETTPLTAAAGGSGYVVLPPEPTRFYQGPDRVFPGGVSPRSRRNKMRQFQCCMGITFM